MDRKLKIGVRELVEFCCRGGNLGYDASPGVNALRGLQTHQKIQRRYRDEAKAEYPIKLLTRIDDTEIELGGRIDLLFADETPPRVEEIKTVHAHLSGGDRDDAFWGQLQVYAAAYARERGLGEVVLSLNLVNLFGQREQRHQRTCTCAELDALVEDILRRYLRWHLRVESRRALTREQARALEFPFDSYRHQQRRFAAEVYRAIREHRRLLVEAPTGSGKTISTLFPAVKAIGEDLCDQVVYLSAKVSGQQQVVDAIELMPVELSYLVIQARARACPCNRDDAEIDADGRCQRCIGFFDRLPDARERLFDSRRLDVAKIRATADEFGLCPFELGLQMLPWADVVIADFNYVFDPLTQLSYFKTDARRKVLLVDELHNLVDRARGMYSASLTRRQIKQASAAANSRQIADALTAMQSALDRELRGQDQDESISTDPPDGLLRASQRFSEKLGFDIFANKRIAAETIEFSRAIFRFQTIGLLFAAHHRSLGYKPLPEREAKLLCLNACDYLRGCYPLFEAVCGFSATLSPPDYFAEALGLNPDCRSLLLDPVFPAQHLAVCVADYVDTRYRERENSIDSICESIARTYRTQPGNYLVFFSSYHFMQQVHDHFSARHPEIDTLLQLRDLDETGQQAFVDRFFRDDGQLGFAIMGGRFAEGIDYRGKALIGAIVVGVGLPQANGEQQLIRDDFTAMQLDGFDFAFRFPGLIRVKQSAGRVIRSERDRGVVVLLERRFRQSGYARYLPAHWQVQVCNSPETLEQSLLRFWKNREESDAADRNSAG